MRLRPALHALALAVAASWTPLPASADGETATPARESLEEFLARARREREAIQKKLQGDVDALLKELEASTDPKRTYQLVERGVSLGQEATPLLVRHLDPGESAVDKDRVRATHVAQALARMDTGPIVADLVALLDKGTPEGKRNSLRVLQGCPERARARAATERVFKTADGLLRQQALRTLISIGGPENEALLAEVLAGGDDQLVSLAIDGFASEPGDGSVEQVRRILEHPTAAPKHAASLLGYFEAHRAALKSADVHAFLRVAQQATVSLDTRVAVIDRLAALQPQLDSDLRKAMEPIVESTDKRLRESGLVLLAKLGDKSSERELIRDCDDVVAKNPRWAEAYVRRADMYVRIGDDDKAIKDYREAFAVGKDDATMQAETHVKLARALVRRGKLKDAAERLRMSTVSMARLKELADDPEFAPLRNSKWGKEAFGID